jgi:uridine kinase
MDPTVAAVLAHAQAGPPRLGDGRLVCIDGPAGSGKTTLAAAVAAAATGTSRVLHMDDIYEGWTGLADAAPRVRDQVLVPLAAGRSGSYLRYDWVVDQFAERHLVPPVDLLVLEGVGSGSPEITSFCSTLVWVSAPEELRLARGLSRDGEEVRERWLAWMADEQRHFERHGLPAAADLHVDHVGRLSAPPTPE